MEKSGFSSGRERLERELRTGCLQGGSSEHLARNLDFGIHFQNEFVQIAQLAEADCAEILASATFSICFIAVCYFGGLLRFNIWTNRHDGS